MKENNNKMILLNKIMKVKNELNSSPLKMTGYNSFNKYNYFELKDISPTIIQLLLKHGLNSRFYTRNSRMFLEISDNKTGYALTWDTKIINLATKNAASTTEAGNYMKISQMVQTYGRRTLWLQALEIIEPVTLENEENTAPKKVVEKNSGARNSKNPETRSKPEKPPEKPETMEILKEMEFKMDRAGVELNNNNAVKYLERLLKNKKITQQQMESILNKLEFETGAALNDKETPN